MNEIKIDDSRRIFEIELMDSNTSHFVATYGDDDHDDLLGVMLDAYGTPTKIMLYNALYVNTWTPDIDKIPKVNTNLIVPTITVEKNSQGDPYIVGDFELYINDNTLFIVLSSKNYDKLVVTTGKTGRASFAYSQDEQNPVYISINNLTKDEHDNLLKRFKEKNVSIIKENELAATIHREL